MYAPFVLRFVAIAKRIPPLQRICSFLYFCLLKKAAYPQYRSKPQTRIQAPMGLLRKSIKPILLTSAVAGATGIAATVTTAAVLTAIGIRVLRNTAIPDGAVILITGGSRGLGFAIASRFAKKPVRLVLAARHREELEKAQSKLLAKHPHLHPDDFYLVAADLAQPSECQRLVAEAIARFGRIDVLVNNAGIIEVGPIESQTTEAFERAMQVNFFAALHTTWAALPHLRTQKPLTGNRRAAIINIASLGGKLAVPHMLPYSAAKFALVGFSEGLHAELRHKGIRITTVCPGLMRTGGEAHAQFVGDVEFERRWFDFAATTPLISTTAAHAASKIYSAVQQGRAEVTITPQAWLAARFAGLAPETTQFTNALVNRWVLPTPPAE
jgi:NAD(P)-dependent dehydrogenase (short-subunit alcohol dehydrogenase family)